MQRRSFWTWAVWGCVALQAISPVQGRNPAVRAPAQGIPHCMAFADLVLLGKVTAIEEKSVSTVSVRGKKEEHQVVVIQAEEVFSGGVKGLTSVRIGFPHNPPGIKGQIPAVPFSWPETMKNGAKGCFILWKHGTENFYVGSFLPAEDAAFDKALPLIKQCARLLADPNAGLKSQNAYERFLTATMIVTRYRTQRTPKAKTEPIDVEQSRLILLALAEADWTKNDPLTGSHPGSAFHLLGLTEKDGWKWSGEFADQAKQWLKANAGTYRLQRFVAAE